MELRPFFDARSRRHSKEFFFGLIGYQPRTREARRFHASDAPLRIISAPARTSKSWAGGHDGAHDFFPDLEEVDGKLLPALPEGLDAHRVWMVGVNYEPLKEWDYAWKVLVDDGLIEAFGGHIETAQNRPNNGQMKLRVAWGKARNGDVVRSVLEGKSGSNEKTLQSEECKTIVLSETADHDPRIWNRYLSARYRWAIWPTTPKVDAAWVKEYIDHAEAASLPGVEHYQFTPHCNPHYNWDRFWNEHAKAESRVLGRVETQPFGHDCFDGSVGCKAGEDWTFAEQYLGEWTMEGNRVIPFRWMSRRGEICHVLDYLPDWFPYAKKYVAVDYGWLDPSAVLWAAVNTDGVMVLYREIYEPKLEVDALVKRIHETSREWGEEIEFYVTDPRKREVERYMRERGLRVYAKDKGAMADRQAGHMRLVDMLSIDPDLGHPRLFVLSDKVGVGFGCPRTIDEWKKLRRKPGVSGATEEWSNAAIVGRDDAYDCVRYLLSARPSMPSLMRYDINDEFDAVAMDVYGHWQRTPQGPLTGAIPGMWARG